MAGPPRYGICTFAGETKVLTFQASDRQAATAVFLLHRRPRGFFVKVSGVPGAGLEKNF